MRHVQKTLGLEEASAVCWTDSSTVVAWLQSSKEQHENVFVRNRIAEIRKLTNPADWNYISGIFNPADLPSRGLSMSKLLQSPLWLHGPQPEQMTKSHPVESELSVSPALAIHTVEFYFPIERYSDLSRALRVVA